MGAKVVLAWRVFRLPKKGHGEKEYEDAYSGDPQGGRFAVADGATESAFAGTWARLLVRAYVRKPGSWSGWLGAARQRWRNKIEAREMPWYAETKIQEGAYATLLGLSFQDGRWLAEAIGDSCLFQVRDRRLRRSFPLQRSSEFTNQPDLIGSHRGNHKPRRVRAQGNWLSGDVYFLMTDALAQWFMNETEQGRQPWRELAQLRTQEQFAGWMENLRLSREIRNDDVTLIRIRVKET